MRGILLVFSLSGPARDHPADRWFAEDKAKHFFVSAFLQSYGYGALRAVGVSPRMSLAAATAGTLSVGAGKEIWDAQGHGTPSGKDLTWDAAGAAAATVLLVRIER